VNPVSRPLARLVSCFVSNGGKPEERRRRRVQAFLDGQGRIWRATRRWCNPFSVLSKVVRKS
jgi:hypothetical protein